LRGGSACRQRYQRRARAFRASSMRQPHTAVPPVPRCRQHTPSLMLPPLRFYTDSYAAALTWRRFHARRQAFTLKSARRNEVRKMLPLAAAVFRQQHAAIVASGELRPVFCRARAPRQRAVPYAIVLPPDARASRRLSTLIILREDTPETFTAGLPETRPPFTPPPAWQCLLTLMPAYAARP